MAKLIEVQRGQDGAVLATASDAALNDAKPVPVMDVAEVSRSSSVSRKRGHHSTRS